MLKHFKIASLQKVYEMKDKHFEIYSKNGLRNRPNFRLYVLSQSTYACLKGYGGTASLIKIINTVLKNDTRKQIVWETQIWQ